MSIDRYAKFISEQALIAKLDEANKNNSEERKRIRPGEIGIQFSGKAGQYDLVDHKGKNFGSITHGPQPRGNHGHLVIYHNPDENLKISKLIPTVEGTGIHYGKGFGEALKYAQAAHKRATGKKKTKDL